MTPLPATFGWVQDVAGVGIDQLVELGNTEGWGLCSGSVEPPADVEERGEGMMKTTGSGSHGVFFVGI